MLINLVGALAIEHQARHFLLNSLAKALESETKVKKTNKLKETSTDATKIANKEWINSRKTFWCKRGYSELPHILSINPHGI